MAGCKESGIVYELPRDGQVSAAVYDKDGRQIRILLAGQLQKAGRHELFWDGLDRLGNPMPPGEYVWKLLMNNGLEADYVAVVGQNPIDPAQPWVPTVGSHQGPSSVLLGSDGSLYHGSRNSEGPPVAMKLASENGPVIWSRNWQSKGPIDMAEIGKDIFLLTWDNHVQRIEPKTGLDSGKPIDVLWPGDKRSGCDDPVDSYAMKFDADGGSLVVAYRNHDALRWINPADGSVLRELKVAKPADVAAGADGEVYVISGASLVSVSGDKLAVIVPEGSLAAPAALAYDSVNRQLLIADGGQDQRVHRFGLDGNEIRAYGKRGGRLDGKFEAADFKDVSHLACDKAGGFYAVESDHLRRIVHIGPDGKVLKQWLGGAPFFMVVSMDKKRPTELWYSASGTTVAVADLDIEKGSYEITRTYSMPEEGFGGGLFPSLLKFPVWRVKHRNEKTFLIHESPAAILRVDEEARRLVPVALASHKAWEAKYFPLKAINDAMEKRGLKYDDEGSDAFTWSDTNGNGELDADEFRFHNVAAPVNNGRYSAFDDQFNIYIGYYAAPNYTYTGKRWLIFDFKDSAYAKLPNTAPAGSDVPQWDWSRLELSKAKVPPDVSKRLTATAVRWDSDDGVTLALRGEEEDRHGMTWPNAQAGSARLLRAAPEGTAWTVSKHESPGMPPATVLRYPGYFPGTTHGCVIECDRNYYGATAWTYDGLYAGFFLDRHADDLPYWAYDPYGRGLYGLLPGDDWECAGSLADLPDGSVLWTPRNSGRSAVFRVRGWDNWFRTSGTVELADEPSAARTDGTGLYAEYYKGKSFSGETVLKRVDPQLWFKSGPASRRAPSWESGPCEGIKADEPFSVRWTGRVVAPFTEDYWFNVKNTFIAGGHVQNQTWKDGAGFVRVWLNNILIIDRSEGAPDGGHFEAGPFNLEAGKPYDLKVEYSSPGVPRPEFSISWASNTKEWERIPRAYLHPEQSPALPVVKLAASGSGASQAVTFSIGAPASAKLPIRYRTEDSDYVPRYWTASIPAGANSAAMTAQRARGTLRLFLEPGASYFGDGSAGTVIVGSNGPVEKGLVSYYPLDEAGGSVIHDRQGPFNGKFETFMNPPKPRWQRSGILGGAMEFAEPGVSARLPGAKIAGDFSVSFWLRTSKSDEPLILGTFDLFLCQGIPKLIFGGWPMTIKDCPRLDDGSWHHLAFVWDQSGGKRAMSLFADGNLAGTGTGPGEGSFEGFALGMSNQPIPEPKCFIGSFDEIRVYNRRLSPEEVKILTD